MEYAILELLTIGKYLYVAVTTTREGGAEEASGYDTVTLTAWRMFR
jgi:hypothetical protein